MSDQKQDDGASIPAGLFRASQTPPSPKKASEEEDAGKKFKSTLVGVPISQPPPPPKGPVLSPPRWEGAAKYEAGSAPEPEESRISQPPPAAPGSGESVRDSLDRILDAPIPAASGPLPTAAAG